MSLVKLLQEISDKIGGGATPVLIAAIDDNTQQPIIIDNSSFAYDELFIIGYTDLASVSAYGDNGDYSWYPVLSFITEPGEGQYFKCWKVTGVKYIQFSSIATNGTTSTLYGLSGTNLVQSITGSVGIYNSAGNRISPASTSDITTLQGVLENRLQQYELIKLDVSTDIKYLQFAKMTEHDPCFIKRIDMTTGEVKFSYPTAFNNHASEWTNRVSLEYTWYPYLVGQF